MAAQTFDLEFRGPWREGNKAAIPAESGVYCVYTCKYNTETEKITLLKLIYIGQAENARERHADHDRLGDFNKHLSKGQELCYSFAPVSAAMRDRCEAALIFKHQPPENTEYTETFPFDQTTINVSGKVWFIKPSFTLERKD